MRNEDLCAMKVKPILSVRTSWSQCLCLSSCTQAPLQVAGVTLCIHKHGSFLGMACVFSLTWFVLLSPEDSLIWFSVIVWFTTHLLLLISFCCQEHLGKFYFPKLACHFCLWRNFMSSPHLIHLTILFSSDSGLLCPQVIFFNIKVHHPWLLQLKGVGERQTKKTSLETAWSLKTLCNKRCISSYQHNLTAYLLKGTESSVLLLCMEETTLFFLMPDIIFWVWQGSSLRNEVTWYICIQMLRLLSALYKYSFSVVGFGICFHFYTSALPLSHSWTGQRKDSQALAHPFFSLSQYDR